MATKEASALKAHFGRVKANLKMGIVGLPNVGKSSLFNLLTVLFISAMSFRNKVLLLKTFHFVPLNQMKHDVQYLVCILDCLL